MKKTLYRIDDKIKDIIINNESTIIKDIVEHMKNKNNASEKYSYNREELFFFYLVIINEYTNSKQIKHLTSTRYLNKLTGLSVHKIGLYSNILEQLNLVNIKTEYIIKASSNSIIPNENINELKIVSNNTFKRPNYSIDISTQATNKILNKYYTIINDLNASNDNKNKAKQSLSKALNKLELIKNKDYNETITSGNRREDVLNTLNKEFRNYLTINNNKTISLDFSNNHPAIVANTFKDEIDESFYNSATNGTFYKDLSDTLNISIDNAKDLYLFIQNEKDEMSWIDYSDNTFNIKKPNRHKFIVLEHIENFYKAYPKTFQKLESIRKKSDSINIEIVKLESNIINELSDLYKNIGFDTIENRDEILIEDKFRDKPLILKVINYYLNFKQLKLNYKINK